MKKGVKNIPFQLEIADEEVVNLEFTPCTIADSLRIGRIQGKYTCDEVSDDDKTECFNLARLVTCVKTPDGEYYWGDDIEPLRGVFNGEMFFYMLSMCTELNPAPVEGDTLAAKKK